MFKNLDPLYFGPAIDARDEYIRTSGFMLVDVLANALGLAQVERRTLDWCVGTVLVVVLNVSVREDGSATQLVVVADKFNVFELLLYFFLDRYKLRFLALHGALASLFGELIETHLMESVVTLLALPWFN